MAILLQSLSEIARAVPYLSVGGLPVCIRSPGPDRKTLARRCFRRACLAFCAQAETIDRGEQSDHASERRMGAQMEGIEL